MAKNKYDFVVELLEFKKLNSEQKEKILKLSVQEIRNESSKDEEILKRIEEIELLIKTDEKKVGNDKANDNNRKDLKNYIDPQLLYNFLKDYNTDPILKTTCHQIDSNELENILEFCETEVYDFIKHKKLVQNRYFEMMNDKNYYVHHNIKNLICAYLTGKKYSGQYDTWTEDKININWDTEEIEKWIKINEGKIPHPDGGLFLKQSEIEFEIKPSINTNVLGQNKLRSFTDVILHFKHLFHLRSDNSLQSIILKINKETQYWKNKIEIHINTFEFPENHEFFTNVEKLVQAYRHIINLIIEVAKYNNCEMPVVQLSLQILNDGMQFSIHHKNSVFKKTIQDTIDKDGQSFKNLINNQINGLCDFYLRADFGNKQFAEINLWNGQTKKSKMLDSFEGVEYILKFKK